MQLSILIVTILFWDHFAIFLGFSPAVPSFRTPLPVISPFAAEMAFNEMSLALAAAQVLYLYGWFARSQPQGSMFDVAI